MNLVKWSGMDNFDRMVDRFFGKDFAPFNYNDNYDNIFGALDLYEKDGLLNIEMDLPGVNVDNINVNIEGDYLKISGNREEVKEEKEEGKNYYRKEISRGNFEKYIKLDKNRYHEEDIEASYKNGVLSIKIPEKEKEIKKIEISVNE